MPKYLKFQQIFESLKSILAEFSGELVMVTKEPGSFYLNTQHIMKNKKPMFFGAVRISKTYVSYHLMPVYVFPELVRNISSRLKQRMQGKSCFNFMDSDPELIKELTKLTLAGYEEYKSAGYI